MSLEIVSRYEPGTGSWTYLLLNPVDRVAALIDPVLVFDPASGLIDTAFTDGLLAEAEKRGCRLEWVLETHAHADHLTAADHIRQRTGARIAIGHGIRSVQSNFQRLFGFDDIEPDGSPFDRLLAEGDSVGLGSQEIRVMETPGHTNDSITYLAGDAAFVGDTLFAPHYGTARCDFPGGDAGALYDSIQRLHGLPDGTRLFLCHDYPDAGVEPRAMVPVEESRETNVHVRTGTTREEFIALRQGRDAKLALPRLILPSVQVNIRAGRLPPPEENGVSYLKIPVDAL